MVEDKMTGWHHQLSGHNMRFEQTPGDGEGQRSLMCCNSWGLRVRQELATEKQPILCSKYPNRKKKKSVTEFMLK